MIKNISRCAIQSGHRKQLPWLEFIYPFFTRTLANVLFDKPFFSSLLSSKHDVSSINSQFCFFGVGPINWEDAMNEAKANKIHELELQLTEEQKAEIVRYIGNTTHANLQLDLKFKADANLKSVAPITVLVGNAI